MLPTRELKFAHQPKPPSWRVFASIWQHGIKNPLMVATVNGQHYVYVGQQRLAAAKILDIEEVPVVFVESRADIDAAYRAYKKV